MMSAFDRSQLQHTFEWIDTLNSDPNWLKDFCSQHTSVALTMIRQAVVHYGYNQHLALGEFTNLPFWLSQWYHSDSSWCYTLIDAMKPVKFFHRYHDFVARELSYQGQHHVINRLVSSSDVQRPHQTLWAPVHGCGAWSSWNPDHTEMLILETTMFDANVDWGLPTIEWLNHRIPLRIWAEGVLIFHRDSLPTVAKVHHKINTFRITQGAWDYWVAMKHPSGHLNSFSRWALDWSRRHHKPIDDEIAYPDWHKHMTKLQQINPIDDLAHSDQPWQDLPSRHRKK